MGDIIHLCPEPRRSSTASRGAGHVGRGTVQWVPLLEGNGFVDPSLSSVAMPRSWGRTKEELRRERYDLAVDFQGLTKSALIAHLARPERIAGFGSGGTRTACGVVLLHTGTERGRACCRSGAGSGGGRRRCESGPRVSASRRRPGVADCRMCHSRWRARSLLDFQTMAAGILRTSGHDVARISSACPGF